MVLNEEVTVREIGLFPLYKFLEPTTQTLEKLGDHPDLWAQLFEAIMNFIRIARQTGRGGTAVDIITIEVDEEGGRGFLVFGSQRRVKVRTLFGFPTGHNIFFGTAEGQDIIFGLDSPIFVTGPTFLLNQTGEA